MYKVSVIIPIYNVEKYIVRCVESLFCQSLDNMQFIFVDDASTDNSIDLLKKTIDCFPQRKKQTIILQHKNNLGIPTARATGLPHVEAPYVAHLDSDDYVDPTMYADLYEKALHDNADIVICGRTIHYPNGNTKTYFDRPKASSSLIHNYLNGRLCPFVWSQITRTEIYRRILFPTETLFEDWFQNAQLLTYANRISFLNKPLYHYIKNPSSITAEKSLELLDNRIKQSLANYVLMHDFIVSHHQVKEKDFCLKKQTIRNLLLPHIKHLSVRQKYLKLFPELNFNILFNLEIPLRYKVAHLLVLLNMIS